NQLDVFVDLMKHLEIGVSRETLREVLDRIQFQKIAGRKAGKEDIHHHYRKGVANDWKNHLTDRHIDLFKSMAGDLLIDLGYEQDHNW
ncbi:MAG: sulfotransferase domain-containing protein, partial [Candidatus Hinthialibacter sp.]